MSGRPCQGAKTIRLSYAVSTKKTVISQAKTWSRSVVALSQYSVNGRVV